MQHADPLRLMGTAPNHAVADGAGAESFDRIIQPPPLVGRKEMHMLAYDYPVMGVFWSMLYFFIFFIWIMLLFRVFADVFRSHDMGGIAKTLWILFVILVPFLGVFVYVIARGNSMAERDMAQAQAQQEAFKSYVQETAGSGGTAEELAKLADLKDRGMITQAEFDTAKAKALT
jgi:hypothetical protein